MTGLLVLRRLPVEFVRLPHGGRRRGFGLLGLADRGVRLPLPFVRVLERGLRAVTGVKQCRDMLHSVGATAIVAGSQASSIVSSLSLVLVSDRAWRGPPFVATLVTLRRGGEGSACRAARIRGAVQGSVPRVFPGAARRS